MIIHKSVASKFIGVTQKRERIDIFFKLQLKTVFFFLVSLHKVSEIGELCWIFSRPSSMF